MNRAVFSFVQDGTSHCGGCTCERRAVAQANLTTREKQVLTHILHGDTNKDIAIALGRSVRTVEFHAGNILHKFRVDSRARLIAFVAFAVI